MLRERIGLLGGNTLDDRKRDRLARSDKGPHLLRNFSFDFFFAANINIATNKFRCQPNVLAPLANGQRELIFVHDDFHLAVLDIGDANLVNFSWRERIGGENRWLV